MMKFHINHQDSYSRGELLLRSFFGMIYIGIPHGICLAFLGLWAGILRFITFWVILFTGKYPESFFNYQLRFFRWALRLRSSLCNLVDGYPAFGLDAPQTNTELNLPYHENYSRGLVFLVGIFGQLILIPHILCLVFLVIGVGFGMIIAWFAVLFTGNYPKGIHDFVVSTMRWAYRIILYLFFMNAQYPPFSGKTDEELAGSSGVLDSKM